MLALTSAFDRLLGSLHAGALFESPPEFSFRPALTHCPHCGVALKVLKTYDREPYTLYLGRFVAHLLTGIDVLSATIEHDVNGFIHDLRENRELMLRDEYHALLAQIDKYSENLFADPIQIQTPDTAEDRRLHFVDA